MDFDIFLFIIIIIVIFTILIGFLCISTGIVPNILFFFMLFYYRPNNRLTLFTYNKYYVYFSPKVFESRIQRRVFDPKVMRMKSGDDSTTRNFIISTVYLI
jgi:hypothetical protein